MSQTKERPILMSGPNIKPILEDRKTQTRGIINPQPKVTEQRLRELGGWVQGMTLSEQVNAAWQSGFVDVKCPHGKPGDRLWVRESGWEAPNQFGYIYDADGCWRSGEARLFKDRGYKRRPSIFMPRWASRILLEITDVRVERLQDISEEDAKAEGIEPPRCEKCGYTHLDCFVNMDHYLCGAKAPGSAVGLYRSLWESINGAGSWDANPWVWVIQFRRIEG